MGTQKNLNFNFISAVSLRNVSLQSLFLESQPTLSKFTWPTERVENNDMHSISVQASLGMNVSWRTERYVQRPNKAAAAKWFRMGLWSQTFQPGMRWNGAKQKNGQNEGKVIRWKGIWGTRVAQSEIMLSSRVGKETTEAQCCGFVWPSAAPLTSL